MKNRTHAPKRELKARNGKMKNIGFIGIGIMGRSMAANLIKAGFR